VTSLFDRLVEASGLSRVIATGVLERALHREGIDLTKPLYRSHVFAARHAIRDALAVYLTVNELHEAMARVEGLCRTSSISYT
jgi:hypothetical protein